MQSNLSECIRCGQQQINSQVNEWRWMNERVTRLENTANCSCALGMAHRFDDRLMQIIFLLPKNYSETLATLFSLKDEIYSWMTYQYLMMRLSFWFRKKVEKRNFTADCQMTERGIIVNQWPLVRGAYTHAYTLHADRRIFSLQRCALLRRNSDHESCRCHLAKRAWSSLELDCLSRNFDCHNLKTKSVVLHCCACNFFSFNPKRTR